MKEENNSFANKIISMQRTTTCIDAESISVSYSIHVVDRANEIEERTVLSNLRYTDLHHLCALIRDEIES